MWTVWPGLSNVNDKGIDLSFILADGERCVGNGVNVT